MDITITTNPSAQDVKDIRDGVIQHNLSKLGEVFFTDFACFTYYADGTKSGGLTGEILGQWLSIKFLWVDSESKGQGIGSELLRQAEQFALEHNCHSSLLDTFSFQARPFYERHGYQVEMTLRQHPISTSERYFMTKTLSS
ncbi:GNAT family N-acetyltransferase [Vibrio sp. 10N.261.51.F12]|uniref:GNAT family N-acetyltransferase n=1 Tax=Vibrio sp. 10N.261.51.F12 TaxID=3229679 RepID=UPI00354F6510